jgi:hypothetical protein
MTRPLHIRWPRRRDLLITVSLAVLFAPCARAQGDRLYVPVGTRVRIVGPAGGQPFTGNVLRLTADTLAVATGGGNALLQVPTSRLTSIDVSEGRDRLGWGMRGAAIGGLAGAVLGAAAMGRDDPGGMGAYAGFIAGGIFGVGGGAIVGAIVAPERWRRLSLSGLVR